MAKRRYSNRKTNVAQFSDRSILIIVALIVIIIVLGVLNAPKTPQRSSYTAPIRTSAPIATRTPSREVPSSCAEARRMGLSARAAGRYSHLDRDGDGVACYGD